MKVLVVDDSLNVRQQVATALSPAGYQLIEAGDGIEGLRKIDATPDLNLILCDVNMPRMGGIEMISEVRTRARRDLPIIILTAEGLSELIAQAARLGVTAWIIKPFKSDLLRAAVTKILRTRPIPSR
jgi:two-component system chemotaxis response regulator CheY